MMKDIHSHLLWGIDDGCKDIAESIGIIKEAVKQGITDLVLTPHYMDDTKYNCNNKEKNKRFEELKKKLKEENIDINLYLGNEVYITENIKDLLKQQEITTINNSKYLLIEFPLGNMLYNSKEILYELVVAGYVPILAHPERYRIFQRHPDHIDEYLRMGVLLQGNYKSLYGKYGKDAKRTLTYYLKKHKITFLGSDCHHEKDFKLKRLKKKLKSLTKSDTMVEDLLENNFNKVILNENIGIRR